MKEPMPPAREAALTYRLPWVPSDQRLVLSHLGSMRRSAVRTDAYEIEVAFLELDEAFGLPLRSWAPFEQLGMLRPGSIFENRVLAGRDGRLVTRQARLQPLEMCQLNIDSNRRLMAYRRRPIGEPKLRSESENMLPWACVAQDKGRQHYLPAGEILRFYFGALSLSAAAFMSLAAKDEADGLFDPEHTRFLEPDVLQIAPAPGLTDRASALNLALLLHSPDLMELWRSTVELFLASGARGEPDFYPEIELPNTRHAFALLGRSEVFSQPFGQSGDRGFMVSSIASDYRPIPFRRLVIKLPHGFEQLELADLDEERLDASSRYQNIVAPDLPLENRRRPGVRVTQLSPFHESLRKAFPALGRVQVDYETNPRAAVAARRTIERREQTIEALSALSPGQDRRVGGVVFRPGRIYSAEPRPAAPMRSLFAEDTELGWFEPVATKEVGYPLSTFIAAFNLLARHGTGGLVYQDPLHALAGEVMLLQPAPSWGNAGRGRVVCVGRLDIASGSVYCFEMSRRRKTESISLGLVARGDGGLMSLGDLSAVARYAVAQLSLRGTPTVADARGVWPSPCSFSDIRGRVAPHTQRRRAPACLAEDLDGLARSLFQQEHTKEGIALVA